MLTALLSVQLCLFASFQLSGGYTDSHDSVRLEIASDGSFRQLVRRENADQLALLHRQELLAELKSGTSGSRDGNVDLGNAFVRNNDSCDERQEMCCKEPKSDPQGLYMMCLQRNCKLMAKPDPVCKKNGVCTNACAGGCCCFWFGTATRLKALGTWCERKLVKLAVMLQAFQQNAVQQGSSVEGKLGQEVRAHTDPAEVAAHAVDVLLDTLSWGVGIPTVSLLVVMLHARVMHLVRKRGPRSKRRSYAETTTQAGAHEDLLKFLDAGEQDRLGGVDRTTMAEMAGISDIMWLLTQAFGVGLYYFLMTEYSQTGLCVLGKSGRVVVINRKPIISGTTAARVIRGAGVTFILAVMMINTYLRGLERAFLQAQKSSDPLVRHKRAQAEPLAKAINGNVSWFTLGATVLLWVVFFAIMKTSIRPWGATDERNYYESKEASVCQYFRTGSRGIIPCLSRRRRRGGLRIFFGPYPERHIFSHLGRDAATLHNLEPCLVLPTETDNGYPQSGGGQPATADEKAATAQLLLGGLNSFLGTLGLVVFGIHMYNFLTNVQNCPMGKTVRDCVQGVDCTSVAKSPWFAHHLLVNGLRSQTDIVSDQLSPKVKIDTIGLWLKTNSTADTEQTVLNVSREACAMRYSELFVEPNSTLNSATSDTIGKFNAANYLNSVNSRGYKIRFDEENYHCKDCVRSYLLYYFTNFDNVIEIIEVLMLMVTSYVSALVYQLTTRRLTNCPMVDLAFASDPGSAKDLDVDHLERTCLAMIGHCFFQRYSYTGVPPHIAELEGSLRRDGTNPASQHDPWCVDNSADSWNNYSLSSVTNRRLMLVNRRLLGILEGEEIVSAWSETPLLTFWQKVSIFGGFLLCFLFPLYFAAKGRSPICAVETVVMELLHIGLVKFYIFDRRPQAGFILTSRRLFQVSRLPAYRDIWGMTEPMVKLDVIIHNSGVAYASMTMEAYAPLWRRALAAVTKMQVYRRGQLIMEGSEGIFKLWRCIGDTRDIFHSFSKVTLITQLESLRPELGHGFKQKESAVQKTDEHLPDPLCSCCCCPRSPPPMGFEGPLLERYVTRKPREKDVYSRKLAVRPSTCEELYCGRGCTVECSCCCCCRLDELSTDFVVTTHRILVEQRTLQRYCRWFACGRKTPNIRTTYLAHHRAAAYLCEKDAKAFGISKIKQDMNLKLLQKDAREYTSGLMLMQRPYAILSKSEVPTFKEELWVTHISYLYDIMTAVEDYVEDINESLPSVEEGEVWQSEEEQEAAAPEAAPQEEEPSPPSEQGGKRGIATKGKGRGPQTGKGKSGRKGDEDGGGARGSVPPTAAVVTRTASGWVGDGARSDSSESFRG